MIDFSAFEEIEREKPFRLLDQHPDGLHLAMQVATSDVFSAAVWNKETKQRVWSPEDAHALAWLQEGTQIAALQNPILSEDFVFTIYSWPQGRLIHQCSLHFPMGFLFDLVISPKSDLAVCQWTEQTEFGFEFINISDQIVTHMPQSGYLHEKTNRSTRPVFSPNGHLWVCCYQEEGHLPNNNDALDQKKRPMKEDQQHIGTAIVFHGTQKLDELPVVPTGTTGDLSQTPPAIFFNDLDISNPLFIDSQHVMILLSSGESLVYDLSQF